MRRHEMRPGLTGYAQVKGFRGPTPRLEDMEARVKADLEYIDNFSVWLDVKIFCQTIWRMITFKL
jgi:putative colanic acid biosynthesis UDP-glucose lipid carrier transferase